MSNELKYPTSYEERQRPAPIEKEKRQSDDNHRYANRVGEFVQRVAMFGFVVVDERLGHVFSTSVMIRERAICLCAASRPPLMQTGH